MKPFEAIDYLRMAAEGQDQYNEEVLARTAELISWIDFQEHKLWILQLNRTDLLANLQGILLYYGKQLPPEVASSLEAEIEFLVTQHNGIRGLEAQREKGNETSGN